jgi:hypothetical protein
MRSDETFLADKRKPQFAKRVQKANNAMELSRVSIVNESVRHDATRRMVCVCVCLHAYLFQSLVTAPGISVAASLDFVCIDGCDKTVAPLFVIIVL